MGRVIIYRAHGEGLQRLDIDANTLDEATLKSAHGIYTVFRVYPARRVLRFQRHLDRMRRSAELLEQPYRVEDAWLRAVTREAVVAGEAEGIHAPRVRLTVPFDAPDTALITLEPFAPPSDKLYEAGIKVVLVTAQRESPRAKNSEFIERRRQLEAGKPPDAYEVILCSEDGAILEGVGSNFYAVLNGELRTAEQGVLPGIARGMLLEAAEGVIPVSLTPVRRDDVARLSEALLTSASRGVLPIVRIGDQVVGEGSPGPVYRALRARYEAQMALELEAL